MRESKIEEHLRKGVEKELGGLCIKFPPLFFRGFPDRIIMVGGGVIVFVETKTIKGKVTTVQNNVHKLLRKLGFRVEVLRSVEDVDKFLLTL